MRRFFSRWYDVDLPPVGRVASEVSELEAQLGVPLPAAVREWVALTEDFQGTPAEGLLRDGRWIAPRPGREGLTLNHQAEDDVVWFVAATDLQHEDPPVRVLLFDYEREVFEDEPSARIATTTLFAATYLLAYLRGEFGFSISDPDLPARWGELEQQGVAIERIGPLTLAEGDGWVAFASEGVGAFSDDDMFHVNVARGRPFSVLPSCLQRVAPEGFHRSTVS